MMHFSLDFSYVEKKLISSSVGILDRLPAILNEFPNSQAGTLPLYYLSFSEQSTKSCNKTYLKGLVYESNESPAVPRYPSISTRQLSLSSATAKVMYSANRRSSSKSSISIRNTMLADAVRR